MIRGVHVETTISTAGGLIYEMLAGIAEEYLCYNLESQYEAFMISIADAFAGETLSESYDALSDNQNGFFISLKLQFFRAEDQFCEVSNYQEFLDSDCQILLLLYDCVYYDIYVKGEKRSEDIYQSIDKSILRELSYITDDNDTRTKMSVR